MDWGLGSGAEEDTEKKWNKPIKSVMSYQWNGESEIKKKNKNKWEIEANAVEEKLEKLFAI